MKNSLFTLNDFYKFFVENNKSIIFNSEVDGYNLAVQVNGEATVFNKEDDDVNSEGLLYCDIKAFHDLSNANTSHIKTSTFKKRLKSMKDRPILADIVVVDEETQEKDFSGHTMKIDENSGEVVYIEQPVGHFVDPEDFKAEYDEEYDRHFAVGRCVIYETYSDACKILRRRKSVSCSVELIILSLSYDAKNKELVIDDFYVNGCTLLGKDVAPGMKGSQVSLSDFSESNNSLFSNKYSTTDISSKLIDTLEKINSKLDNLDNVSNFNIKDNPERKEEVMENKKVKNEIFEENIENAAEIEVAEIPAEDSDALTTTNIPKETSEKELFNTEVENFDEEKELIEKFEEITDDIVDDKTNNGESEQEESEGIIEDKIDIEVEEVNDYSIKSSIQMGQKEYNFSVSLNEKIYALSKLVNETYSEADNAYYSVEVFDKHVIMVDMWTGSAYRQNYKTRSDNFSLIGDRVPVYARYLTKDEEAELDKIQSNYSSIQERLAAYEYAEEHDKKEALLNSEDYSILSEDNNFKNLIKNMDNYSLEDLEKEADLALAKFVKITKTFSSNSNEKNRKKKVNKVTFSLNETPSSDDKPYGNLFEGIEKNNN